MTLINMTQDEANKIAVDSAILLDSKLFEESVEQYAQELVKLATLRDVAVAPNFSDNFLSNPLQNVYPLYTWLSNTSLSRKVKAGEVNGNITFNGTNIMLPYEVFTLPIDEIAEGCCWLLPDIDKCANDAPMSLLCLKDCENKLMSILDRIQKGKANDMIGYFLRQGETLADARKRLAREMMAFYTANTVINGTMDTETPILKPYHGLYQVIRDSSTALTINGEDLESAIEIALCRIAIMNQYSGTGEYSMSMHPLIYASVASFVRAGQYGTLADGWSMGSNGYLSVNGIQLLPDVRVPYNQETATGDIWILDGRYVGNYLVTSLMPADEFIDETTVVNNVVANGCATDCTYYWNAGAAFTTNPTTIIVIQGVQATDACMEASAGLDNIITPNTLVPRT